MIYGLSGAPVNPTLLYAGYTNRAAVDCNFPPAVIYAVAYHETISSYPKIDPATYISDDQGHGLCQLTASWPDGWADPYTNATYAILSFLEPAIKYWHGLYGYQGTTLLKLVAATYNEGLGAAIKYHEQGNVDAGTTNDYGQAIVDIYTNLTQKGIPT